MKYCFCSSYIGNIENFQNRKFERINDVDYFLFTNLLKEEIGVNSWDIINVDLKDNLHISSLRTNTHMSRYYKFQLHKILGKNYDFIFYMDHYIVPKVNMNWKELALKTIHESTETILSIVQKRHCENSIISECNFVVSLNKENVFNMNKAIHFMSSLCPSMNLGNDIDYVENCIFGYSTKHINTTKFFDDFWNLYIDAQYYTYRDQPLWNFMYKYKNKKCHIELLQNYIHANNNKQFDINSYNKKISNKK